MQKINVQKLKRDCFIALMIPALLLGIFQFTTQKIPSIASLVIMLSGALIFFLYVYRFFSTLEEMTWKHQISSVIKTVTTPALIADKNHCIKFANDSFERLSISTLLTKFNYLQDLLMTHDDNSELFSFDPLSPTGNFKETLDVLTGRMKKKIIWNGEIYEWVMVPLLSDGGKRWGTLVECLPVKLGPVLIEKHDDVIPKERSVSNMMESATHPMIILDSRFRVQQATNSIIQLIAGELKVWQGLNFFNIVRKSLPKLASSLQRALKSREISVFIAEHDDKFCDWRVTPLKDEDEINGFMIEIISPSQQELKALEESTLRVHQHKFTLEKQLAKFTNGLAKYKLYQSEKSMQNSLFQNDDYQHPLLRNSSKIIQQMTQSLKSTQSEVDHLKALLQTQVVDLGNKPLAAPLHQLNILSGTIVRNVQEVKHDFNSLIEQLTKLKRLISVQKNITSAYVKPVGKAVHSTEQALIQTIGYSETVTMVVQQLHENQNYLAQLQTLSEKLIQASKHNGQNGSDNIHHGIVKIVDVVKQAVMTNKNQLKDLVANFEKLRSFWNQTLDSLKSCFHISLELESVTENWGNISQSAHEHSEIVQMRIQGLIELTEKIQLKTRLEIHSDGIVDQPSAIRSFSHTAIEVVDSKRKAEDVLLEGIIR